MKVSNILKRNPLSGAIDGLTEDGELRGWLARTGSPNAVTFQVCINTPEQSWDTEAKADHFRADLIEHLQTEGHHGFQVALPDFFFDGSMHEIKIYVAGQKAPVLEAALSAQSMTMDAALDALSDRGTIVGWAGRKRVSAAANIVLLVDDVWSTTVNCNRFRKDLAAHLKTEGKHGFEVVPHDDLFDGCMHQVTILGDNDTILAQKDLMFPSRHHLFAKAPSQTIPSSLEVARPRRGLILGRVTSTAVQHGASVIIHNECGETLETPVVSAAAYKPHATSNRGDFVFSVPLSWRQAGHRPVRVALAHESECYQEIPPVGGRDEPSVLLVCDANNPRDGSRFYRAELASRQLKAAGLHTQIVSVQDVASQKVRVHMRDYDVVVFQRPRFGDVTSRILKDAKSEGALCLFEADDLLFKSWRRGESGVVRSGTITMSNTGHKQGMDMRLQLMQHCDGVITSTHYLDRELRSLGLPAIISRNCVETDALKYGALRLAGFEHGKQDLKILFMSGTPTHNADFTLIEDVLQKILLEYPNAGLSLMGQIRPSRLDRFDRVVRRPVLPRAHMLSVIAKHDLVLAPMERTGFNTGKSSLKFIESGACGVPVIATDMYEFRRDITASDGGRLAQTAQDWYLQISEFCKNPDLSFELGANAFAYMSQNYTTDARGDYLWREIQRFHQRSVQNSFDPAAYILRKRINRT